MRTVKIMRPKIMRPMMLFWDGYMWRRAYPNAEGDRLVCRDSTGEVRLDLKISDARILAQLEPANYKLWGA